ncbi:MAG: hypothetical protein VR72_13350 [Clostridiaceae bacterium BRH_c20a]|nr:MAG: hypothetical protein VR72_13350 [Clostridiaceae bacterium BRH_c20a]
MKEKDFVIAGVIGWLAGPFAFVYLGQKTPIRALVELLAIIAVAYATSWYVLVPFVLGYSMLGLIAARRYNNELKKDKILEKAN